MHIERLFTTGSLLPQEMVSLSKVSTEHGTFIVPDDWSLEAIESFQEAFAVKIPAHHRAIEENTTPSWLWPHRADGKDMTSESSVLDVFDRIVGAATYNGWKQDLWHSETAALTFYDEARALLLTRRLVIAPKDMTRMGLEWAYSMAPPKVKKAKRNDVRTDALILQNDTIDQILRDTHPLAMSKWDRFLQNSQGMTSSAIVFADTMTEWGSTPYPTDVPAGMLNLSAFRQEDGKVDIVGLGQASKIATLLLELHYDAWSNAPHEARPIKLGMGNLASLLMSLGLAYDSDKARGTAAALSASITATATITSAQIAGKIGSCKAFDKERSVRLRVLRNKIRAVFGEKTDYDRLSIVPQTLDVASGADLVLISTARYTSEEALRLVEKHGLRHLQLTDLYTDKALAPLMDCTSQGIAPEATLTCDYALDDDTFERRARPAVEQGLLQLGLEESDIKAVDHHVVGYRTLIAAPVINHYTLREKGFDDKILERIETVLRNANHLSEAFTPWILGQNFCAKKLRIHARSLKKPNFDTLKHLGFTTKEIERANAFCCGHRNVKGVLEVTEKMRPVFTTVENTNPEAITKMAAITQSFVSGDADVTLRIPSSITPDIRAQIILKAWELGLKSMTLEWDGHATLMPALQEQQTVMKRKTPGLAQKQRVAPLKAPYREIKPRATSRTVSLKSKGKGKTAQGRK